MTKHSLLLGHRQFHTSWGALLLLFLLLPPALAACTSAAINQSVPNTPVAPSQTATPTVPSQAVPFTTRDGVALMGTLYGSGAHGVGVILSNGGDNVSGPWVSVAQQLATHGYLVLSYAYRAQDASQDQLAIHALTDLQAAISFMRARHMSKLMLIGASLGALVSLKVAITEPCNGLVAISSPMGYQDVQLHDADFQHLTMPKLFLTSADNQPFAAAILHMFAISPQPKQERIYPGDAHGTDLFAGASGTDLLATLLAFVQSSTPIS